MLRFLLPLLLLLPTALQAQSVSPYGTNVHAPRERRLPFLFDKVRGAGIAWIRIDLVWAAVEPEAGSSRWEDYDAIVEAARSRDLRILALIGYTPAWATDGPEISGVPRNTSDWFDFCYRAAERYRDDIRHWEIWNEPNLKSFWVGNRLEYIDGILRPAADAIRAANPEALVGGPALAHFVSQGRDWHGWLRDIVNEAGNELDFLTHHAYDLDGPRGLSRLLAAETEHGDDPARWAEQSPSLREALAWLDWERPVWLTETGWVTSRLDETRQSHHYRDFLEEWLSGRPGRDWLAKVFFYEMQDDRDPRVPNFGILRPSGREKPAYRVYRDFIASHPASVPDAGATEEETAVDPGPGDGAPGPRRQLRDSRR